jgi:hypothetical protein
MTGFELKNVTEVCAALQLNKTYQLLRKHLDYAKAKIQSIAIKDVQASNHSDGYHNRVSQRCEVLLKEIKLDFSDIEAELNV